MAEERTTSSTGGKKGVKLERHDLIPAGSLEALAVHFGRGAKKYDDHQWRKGYEWSKSYSAIQRHLRAFWSGEDFDFCPKDDKSGCTMTTEHGTEFVPEPDMADFTCYNHTGSLHMTCVMWHAAVLIEFWDSHPDHDDRYLTRDRIRAKEDALYGELSDTVGKLFDGSMTDASDGNGRMDEFKTEMTREDLERVAGRPIDEDTWTWVLSRNTWNSNG